MSDSSRFVCLGGLLHVVIGISSRRANIFRSCVPFPDPFVLAMVLMPTILSILGSVLSLCANCPLASAHHMRELALCMRFMVSRARFVCRPPSTV